MKVWNRSKQSVFVHIAMVGDKGTCTTFTLKAGESKVYRPGWPTCGWTADCKKKQFKVTFWENSGKYWENIAVRGAIAGLIKGLGVTCFVMEMFAQLYEHIGDEVLRPEAERLGVIGGGAPLSYDGGWIAFWGKGWACDVGKGETQLLPPWDRKPPYIHQADKGGKVTKLDYPAEMLA